MKHKLIILALLLISSTLTVGLLSLINAKQAKNKIFTASSKTIWVPDNYTKIQEAIDAASDGDIIRVGAGTYYEHVLVDKTVSLIGENKRNTIVDGNGTGIVIDIKTDNVNISGFTIQKSGLYNHGIRMDFSSNNNISHNIIVNNWYGIYLFFSGNNTLEGNNASNNYYGIYLYNSSDNRLSGNTGFDNEFGIYFLFSSNNTLSDSTFSSNNWGGIWLGYSSNNTLSGNNASNNKYNFGVKGDFNNYVDTSNTVDGKPIYYLIDTADAVYDAKTNAGTVYLINCNNITIKDLNLTKNYYGVFLRETTNSHIENVTFSENYYGIWLGCSSNNTLTDNTVSDNWGTGMYLNYSSNNIITDNTFFSQHCGIQLEGSKNNTFFHNNFTKNYPRHAITDGISNTWDDGYPSGGNCWSDQDPDDWKSGPNQDQPGSDGIVDFPYVIDTNNIDRYPLVPEFPFALILPLLMIVTLVAFVFRRTI